MSEPPEPGMRDSRVPSLRRRTYAALDPQSWPHTGLSPVNKGLVVFIVLASVAAILETERRIYIGREPIFSRALAHLVDALKLRRYELIMSIGFATLLLVFSSALLYMFEGRGQPEAFGSIPRAMWWSVVTLTTVGYGDAYPVTAMGRIFAALTAFAGIGLIAMPTGILAAAFSDVVQRENINDADSHDP